MQVYACKYFGWLKILFTTYAIICDSVKKIDGNYGKNPRNLMSDKMQLSSGK